MSDRVSSGHLLQVMQDHEEGLLVLAGAVLDGTPVDWDAALASASDAMRPLVERLRSVAAVNPASDENLAAPPRLLPMRTGEYWGPLQLKTRLGVGSSGEVWRAHDSRLERDVALKLLPETGAGAAESQSVIQEARLLARVRHPRVVTIHGAEARHGRVGLSMELVEGDDLESLLRTHGPFPPREAVAIGVDVCEALHAVHEAGVLHRDVKAQNVRRTPDGRIVLVDFGSGRDLEVTDQPVNDLSGTPLYLAPEVFAGGAATRQSDIYSVGVLLFHLLTGEFPVLAQSVRKIAAAHRDRTCRSVRELKPRLPRALARAIDRALTRDPSGRFPSADAFARALRSADPQRRRLRLAGIAALGLLFVTVLDLASSRRPHSPALQLMAALPLTADEGFAGEPSLSPDGSQVAFTRAGPTLYNPDIYIKPVGPGQPVRLTTNPASDRHPAWSPDGTLIAFLRVVEGPAADLMVIPALGGAERKLATISLRSARGAAATALGDRSSLCWTADSKSIVFGGGPSDAEPRGIWLIAVDGGTTRRLTETGPLDLGDWSPALSLDGRYLAFTREHASTWGAVYVVPMSSASTLAGVPARVSPERADIGGLAWTPGGDGVVFSMGGHVGPSRLFRVGIPATWPSAVGDPELLPVGENARYVSVSKTGRLVYSATSSDADIWRIDLAAEGPPAPSVVARSTLNDHTPDYSPDGKRLAFASTRSGTEEIWIANADGSNPVQVTSMGGPQCANPQWSSDSKTILFNSRREGSADLYLLQPDTGVLHRITDDPDEELEPRWSRDGQAIYFGSNRSGRYEVWKMPAKGGAAVRITQHGGLTAMESWDRRFLYYAKRENSITPIWRVPVGGGEEVPVVDGMSYNTNFVVAERGIYFLAARESSSQTSIDCFEFATGKRTTLLNGGAMWFGMALSRDQRWLLYSTRARSDTNLMLVDKFR